MKCISALVRAGWIATCLSLSACQTTPKTEPTVAVSAPVLPAEEPRILKTQDTIAQVVPAPYHLADKTADNLGSTPLSTAPHAAEPVELPIRPPPRIVVEPANPKIQTISYQSKTNGLVHALEEYLERHNEEALAVLKRYPVEDQEFLLIVVPMLAQIELGEAWASLSPAQRLANLEVLRDLVRRRSKSAPLALQKVMFVDHYYYQDKSPQFGEVKARSNNLFRPGDLVYLYYEVLNLVDHLGEDDLYHLKLNVTVQLCNQEGRTEWADTKPFKRPGSISPRTDFAFPAFFTVPLSAVPGNYQLNLIITDMATGRQAKTSLPLQVVERAVRQSKKN
jgi:hypothetical protein